MNDRDQIERLHETDMAASRSGDYRTLRRIVSDDAVVLPPGAPALRGKTLLDEAFGRMAAATPEIEVLDYQLLFEDVTVSGDYAIEWGYIRGKTRHRTTGDESSEEWKVLRVLRRDAAGNWQVFRSMWNATGR
jgi:ketosteroid isomerase-like protein